MSETPKVPLHLFEGYGIEIEWMIVARENLDVRAITDEVLKQVNGGIIVNEVERGPICWSNELALHVIEVKSNGPAPRLAALPGAFQQGAQEINDILKPMGAMLLPTGAHPWMDPHGVKLWPHEYNPIYEAYDRIFHCQGHGWANLQSVHVNLPFSGDAEFARLHAAIRLVLPILPALSASTPFLDGRASPYLDARLDAYRHHMDAVPSLIGQVVPEPVYSREAYEREILGKIYKDLEPHDPEKVLMEEWANARGAIARFDRMAIEIRVIDTQECPLADLTVAAAAADLVRALCEDKFVNDTEQRAFPTTNLAAIFSQTLTLAGDTVIEDRDYLALFGCSEKKILARDLWRGLLENIWPAGSGHRAEFGESSDVILGQGCLARRIRTAAGESPSREKLAGVYREIAACLAEGRLFAR